MYNKVILSFQWACADPLAEAEADASTCAEAIIFWIPVKYAYALWDPLTASACAARTTTLAFCSASRLAYSLYDFYTAASICASAFACASK